MTRTMIGGKRTGADTNTSASASTSDRETTARTTRLRRPPHRRPSPPLMMMMSVGERAKRGAGAIGMSTRRPGSAVAVVRRTTKNATRSGRASRAARARSTNGEADHGRGRGRGPVDLAAVPASPHPLRDRQPRHQWTIRSVGTTNLPRLCNRSYRHIPSYRLSYQSSSFAWLVVPRST